MGYYQKGTAHVEVEVIDPVDYQRNSVAAPAVEDGKPYRAPEGEDAERLPANTFYQAGAFSTRAAAEQKKARIVRHTDHPVTVREGRGDGRALFKVLVGPLADHTELVHLRSLLMRTENLKGFVVYD